VFYRYPNTHLLGGIILLLAPIVCIKFPLICLLNLALLRIFKFPHITQSFGVLMGCPDGTVYQIMINEVSGIQIMSFTRNSGILSKVTSLFYGSTNTTSSCIDGTLIAILPGQISSSPLSRSAYIISTERFQKWRIFKSASEKLMIDIDLRRALVLPLEPLIDGDLYDFNVTVVDVDSAKDNQFVFLVYLDDSAGNGGYFLVVLQEEEELNDQLVPIFAKRIMTNVSPQSDCVKMRTFNGGPAVVLAFSERLVVTTIIQGLKYEETIPFRKKSILGLGVETSKIQSREIEAQSLAIVCTTDGILEIDVCISSLTNLIKEVDERQFKETSLDGPLAERLEQAVFFTSSEIENPISLKIKAGAGDIQKTAVQLSFSILDSSNPHLRAHLDLSTFLRDRFARIDRIVTVLCENNLMPYLDIESKWTLLFNSEILSMMNALWEYQLVIFQYFHIIIERGKFSLIKTFYGL
jgi:hypothetical protein